jgi:hypothetical protein
MQAGLGNPEILGYLTEGRFTLAGNGDHAGGPRREMLSARVDPVYTALPRRSSK